jgi:hypothetical protein
MIPGQKQERVFNDPVPGKYSIKKELTATQFLNFKFHFFYPLVTAAINLLFILSQLPFLLSPDFSKFTRTDMLLYLLIILVTTQGVILFLRLTDFGSFFAIFEKEREDP